MVNSNSDYSSNVYDINFDANVPVADIRKVLAKSNLTEIGQASLEALRQNDKRDASYITVRFQTQNSGGTHTEIVHLSRADLARQIPEGLNSSSL